MNGKRHSSSVTIGTSANHLHREETTHERRDLVFPNQIKPDNRKWVARNIKSTGMRRKLWYCFHVHMSKSCPRTFSPLRNIPQYKKFGLRICIVTRVLGLNLNRLQWLPMVLTAHSSLTLPNEQINRVPLPLPTYTESAG